MEILQHFFALLEAERSLQSLACTCTTNFKLGQGLYDITDVCTFFFFFFSLQEKEQELEQLTKELRQVNLQQFIQQTGTKVTVLPAQQPPGDDDDDGM